MNGGLANSIPHPARPRLPILFSGLAILWSAGWYGAGIGQALMMASGVCVLLALLLPRSLLGTVRSRVWSGTLLLVVCLAANMERIFPPEDAVDLMRLYQYDRIVTVACAVALTSLFFTPSTGTITLAVGGAMPMLIYALGRRQGIGAEPWIPVVIWGGLGFFVLAGLVQRSTQTRPAGVMPFGWGEGGRRSLAALIALAVAVGLTVPIERTARLVREAMLDTLYNSWTPRFHSRNRWLSLQAPPGGFAGKVRPLLSIRAETVPGYLRESVFLRYAGGQWIPRSSSEANAPAPLAESEMVDDVIRFPLIADAGEGDTVWQVQMLAPHRLDSLCLTGRARVLELGDRDSPVMDADGIVSPEDGPLPGRYAVHVESMAREEAFPGPDPAGNADYLNIPPLLTDQVAGWVADCPGLIEAGTPQAAIRSIVEFFHDAFAYSLDPVGAHGEPLVAFMNNRQGHCTLFASAATLMLRAKQIPARMVAGYVCTERHPLTGRWVVRERNGHAWCEAWDSESGQWRLVEATPPGGWPEGFDSPGRLRLGLEALRSAWRSFVDYIREVNPLLFLGEAGLTIYVHGSRFLGTPLGRILTVALIGWGGWLWRRRRLRIRKLDPIEKLRARLVRAMVRLERKSVPANMRRRLDEPWRDWHDRVAADLPASVEHKLSRLLARYQDLRYRSGLDPAQARRWMDESRRPWRD